MKAIYSIEVEGPAVTAKDLATWQILIRMPDGTNREYSVTNMTASQAVKAGCDMLKEAIKCWENNHCAKAEGRESEVGK